jgi:hypothetical protein
MARTTGDKQPELPPQRRGWVGPVGRDSGQVGAGAFAKAGFSDPTLVLRWTEIAGPEVARLCQPLRFNEGPSGGVLTLRAAPGAALFLGHETRSLCQRINSYLGRTVVSQLKFSQGALIPRPTAPKPGKPPVDLPPSDPSRAYDGPEGLANALRELARRR